ncbi:hypothetical protein Taro_056457 [Colocasia esculenta]|uniref:Tyrosinase copper-binding domain-containing protein n=1 Tax=Colocasia esculenta TaxID=4460 RepID=A0A843XW89_COLES|nr:hypothetical protein [Colocasia esculenta]
MASSIPTTLPGNLHPLDHPNSTTYFGSSNSSFACLFSHQARRRGRPNVPARPMVTTCSAGEDDLLRSLHRLERRDVVLGGLAGLGLNGAASALANPIAPPDLSKCHLATAVDDSETSSKEVECCPPFSDSPVEFAVPSFSQLRLRRAAHLVDPDYISKFELAVKLMKDLPGDDPRNFYQQANVHCAYCNDAYDQVGVADSHENQLHIQVHACWLFLPWHRMYLYFYERILGKLIGDENFAIPFWNWDHPEGMQMPALYTKVKSPLYNPNRNPKHLPPTTLLLDYSGTDPDDADDPKHIRDNLALMHRQMITNAKTPEQFMGARFASGDTPNPGAGSLETSPHNNIHSWSGDPANAFSEDMGNFYSAGRDIMFYGLHANVDRMWDVWTKTLGNKDFTEDDYLNAAFFFYDEEKRLVKVKVSDVVDSEKMGYTYETRELPWRYTRPTRKIFKTADQIKELAAKTTGEFPLVLTSTVSTVVKRPKKARSDKERAAEEEVLVIQDIELASSNFAKFDVFVNAPDTTGLTPSAIEFAGSFSNVPHKKEEGAKGIKPIGTNLRLGLSELLQEIDAEGDETIVVTLVPRKGGEKIKVGSVAIEYITIR